MKKSFMGLAAFVLVMFLLVGCGSSKKLVCKQTLGNETLEFIYYFEGNKAVDMEMNDYLDVTDYTETELKVVETEDLCDVLESTATYKFGSCKQSKSGNEVSVKAKIDMDKVPSEDKVGSPEKTKESIEAAGYTCELK